MAYSDSNHLFCSQTCIWAWIGREGSSLSHRASVGWLGMNWEIGELELAVGWGLSLNSLGFLTVKVSVLRPCTSEASLTFIT